MGGKGFFITIEIFSLYLDSLVQFRLGQKIFKASIFEDGIEKTFGSKCQNTSVFYGNGFW